MVPIDFGSLKKPNIWSYTSLNGYSVMVKKAKGEDVSEEKRKVLEYIIKNVKLPIEKINQALDEIKKALLASGYNVKQTEIKALSRGLIGGSETFGEVPFEVGLCFDSIMNVPHIPGSTIKGAVRSATYELLYREKRSEGLSDIEAKKEADDECNRIFGCPVGEESSAGLVNFTDAYPLEEGDQGFLLHPDVMTPHYGDDVKTELEVSPTPIIYLTIAPGAKFRFFMFYKRKMSKRELDASDLLDYPTKEQTGAVDRGLLYAFIRGLGAKTALGYSRFEILSYERISI